LRLEQIHLVYVLSAALLGSAAWNISLKSDVDEGARQRLEQQQDLKALGVEARAIRDKLTDTMVALGKIEGHLSPTKGEPK
jgi:hypothetical protein